MVHVIRFRRLFALGAATITGLLAAGFAPAAPAPTATVVLVCDRNVDAVVELQLQVSLFVPTVVGSTRIECGPDSLNGASRERQRVPVSGPYGWVNVSLFTVSDATGGGGCPGAGVVTFKRFCEIEMTGRGATLTVR